MRTPRAVDATVRAGTDGGGGVPTMAAPAVVAALLLGVLGIAAGALEVPYLSGRVTDEADMVPAEAESRIESELAAFEQRTGHQVAVLTVPSLEGEALEDYSLRVAETWALGREGVDDGVLLLVARDERRMRLEVGYGLEPELTDLASRRILDDVIRPRFRQGDFGAGVEAGVEAVIGVLEEGVDSLPPPRSEPAGPEIPLPMRLLGTLFLLVTLGTFAVSAVASRGCQGWGLYLFLVPFLGVFPGVLWGPRVGVATVVVWLILFPLVRLWASRFGRPAWMDRMAESGGRGGIFGGSSSGGGGFSSGGFSGGGGSFGGGGASSSW